MTRFNKRLLWGVGLVMAALVVALAPPPQDEGLVLSARTQRASARVETIMPAGVSTARIGSPAETYVLLIQPRIAADPAEARMSPLFESTRWSAALASQPTPVPQAPVVATAAPLQAPTLPFRVLGRYDDGDREAIFLQQDDRNFVVHVGDSINELYKVEGIHGTTLTLRYLPLNQLQSLDVGGGA